MNNPRVLIGADVPGQIQQQEEYLEEKHVSFCDRRLPCLQPHAGHAIDHAVLAIVWQQLDCSIAALAAQQTQHACSIVLQHDTVQCNCRLSWQKLNLPISSWLKTIRSAHAVCGRPRMPEGLHMTAGYAASLLHNHVKHHSPMQKTYCCQVCLLSPSSISSAQTMHCKSLQAMVQSPSMCVRHVSHKWHSLQSQAVCPSKASAHPKLRCLQSQADSQYHDLLSQSQSQLPAEGADEGEIDRELRTLNERVFEAQQQLMDAQSACSRAQEAETEAHSIWEAKRCVATLHVSSVAITTPRPTLTVIISIRQCPACNRAHESQLNPLAVFLLYWSYPDCSA